MHNLQCLSHLLKLDFGTREFGFPSVYGMDLSRLIAPEEPKICSVLHLDQSISITRWTKWFYLFWGHRTNAFSHLPTSIYFVFGHVNFSYIFHLFITVLSSTQCKLYWVNPSGIRSPQFSIPT